MKKLTLCAVLLLLSSIANASVIRVVTRPIAMGGGASLLMFGYDDWGNAWVEEKDTNGGVFRDSATDFLRFPLPGLRFNPLTRQIRFGPVVCAHVVPMAAGFSVYKTGRCNLHSIVADTGYPVGIRFESIVMDVR